jgi:hypothetical protein
MALLEYYVLLMNKVRWCFLESRLRVESYDCPTNIVMLKEVRVPEVCDAIAMDKVTYDDPTKKPLRKNEEASFSSFACTIRPYQ